MFCMYCGQVLPEGARFCLKCGTAQGQIAPDTGTDPDKAAAEEAATVAPPATGDLNLDGSHTFVPAMCPNCNAQMKVDQALKVARCNSCGTECLVQDAIKTLTVKGSVQVNNATINLSGADTDDFIRLTMEGGANTEGLLQRVRMLLARGEFAEALVKCDILLDYVPTNGEVYLLMLMADLGIKRKEDLADQDAPFDGNDYYLNAMQYGDAVMKAELQGYVDTIKAKYADRQKNPKEGDQIYFGTGENGRRIWWKVLKVDSGRALIVSRDILTVKPYNKEGGEITWKDCSLRKWLNEDFVNKCLLASERDRISDDETDNCIDKVFLLNVIEANAFFAGNTARAAGQPWWILSTGSLPTTASVVDDSGQILRGNSIRHKDLIDHSKVLGVRPAMWVKVG